MKYYYKKILLKNKIKVAPFLISYKYTLLAKIRDNKVAKILFMLIVGEKEEEAGTVGVRKQGEGDVGGMSMDDLVKYFTKQL